MRPSAYHLRQSDIRKLILAVTNFRDRTLIKALWWLGLRRHELIALEHAFTGGREGSDFQ
jgi:hypothetical protein